MLGSLKRLIAQGKLASIKEIGEAEASKYTQHPVAHVALTEPGCCAVEMGCMPLQYVLPNVSWAQALLSSADKNSHFKGKLRCVLKWNLLAF